MASQEILKRAVAQAAVDRIAGYFGTPAVIGVGTGSTADLFIDALSAHRDSIAAVVASSERSAARLREHGLRVVDLNDVAGLPVYVDGADEIDGGFAMIKGGGAARQREGFVTDNGNVILDVHGLKIRDPVGLEQRINQIAGVVTVGLFAQRGADVLLLGTPQ